MKERVIPDSVFLPWSGSAKAPYTMYRGPNGKTIAELKPIVGDRFRITPGGDDWWEVVKVVERGVVVELWGTHGHFTLWENDMVAYPV